MFTDWVAYFLSNMRSNRSAPALCRQRNSDEYGATLKNTAVGILTRLLSKRLQVPALVV